MFYYPITNLRLKKFAESQSLLEQYVQKLNEMEISLKEIESDVTWDSNYEFITTERDWAQRMLIKVKVMQYATNNPAAPPKVAGFYFSIITSPASIISSVHFV